MSRPKHPAFALLLLLYPKEMRRHADEMWEVVEFHAARWRSTGVRWLRLRVGWFILREAAAVIPAAHALAWRQRHKTQHHTSSAPHSGFHRHTGKLSHTGRELGHAIRRLGRRPGFAAASILSLSIGIGATAAITAIIHGVVLRPLPYSDADRLVMIDHVLPGYSVGGEPASFVGFWAQYLQYRERSQTLTHVGAYSAFEGTATGTDAAEVVMIGRVTPELLEILAGKPLTGRMFDTEDSSPADAGSGVAVLSYERWQRSHGADPSIVGKTVRHEGVPYEVVGVLPPEFELPTDLAGAYHVRSLPSIEASLSGNPAYLVGRMAPDATLNTVARELDALIAEVLERYPDQGAVANVIKTGRMRARVTPLKEWVVRDVARSLWLLLGAVLIVFVMTLVNVTSLLLVRADDRLRELALRRALGATRGRLLGHFLAEGAVLVACASALATLMTMLGLGMVQAFAPPDIPRLQEIRFGPTVVTITVLTSLVTLLVVTAVPFLHFRRYGALRSGFTSRVTAGRARYVLRRTLVATQLAMALLILVGAGLMVRSFIRLTDVDLGFDPVNVLTFDVVFPFGEVRSAGANGTAATQFYIDVADRLRALPGVTGAGVGVCSPMKCIGSGSPARPLDDPARVGENAPVVDMQQAGSGFLETLGVPLLAGRPLERADHELRRNVTVISAGLAEQFWPDLDPIGRILEFELRQPNEPPRRFTVVGVVGDVHLEDVQSELPPVAYLPLRLTFQTLELWRTAFVVRTSTPPLNLVAAVRDIVSSLRSDVPIGNPEPLTEAVDRATVGLRFALGTLMLASGVAIALGSVGVFGVVAYVVRLRRAELAIRLALGADAKRVQRQVLQQGLIPVCIGLAVGLAAALVASRALETALFGVAPTDPPTYAVALTILFTLAAMAAYLPARRTAALDPAQVLRAE